MTDDTQIEINDLIIVPNLTKEKLCRGAVLDVRGHLITQGSFMATSMVVCTKPELLIHHVRDNDLMAEITPLLKMNEPIPADLGVVLVRQNEFPLDSYPLWWKIADKFLESHLIEGLSMNVEHRRG